MTGKRQKRVLPSFAERKWQATPETDTEVPIRNFFAAQCLKYRKTLDRSLGLYQYKLPWPPACIQDPAFIRDPASVKKSQLFVFAADAYCVTVLWTAQISATDDIIHASTANIMPTQYYKLHVNQSIIHVVFPVPGGSWWLFIWRCCNIANWLVLISCSVLLLYKDNAFCSTTSRNCALHSKRWILYDFHERFRGKHNAVTVWWVGSLSYFIDLESAGTRMIMHVIWSSILNLYALHFMHNARSVCKLHWQQVMRCTGTFLV